MHITSAVTIEYNNNKIIMDYLVSDIHLDHDNIIDYCDRPFSSVEEMNETLVEHWNAVVDRTTRCCTVAI